MSLDYYIEYRLNAGGWTHQGAATINPNSYYDAGEVSQRTSRVNNGSASILIQSNAVTYR